MWLDVFYIAFITCALGEKRASRLVQTAQGPVRGYKNNDHNAFTYYSIPYATAPTGADKFKAPLPPPQWLKPFDAEDKRIICPQRDYFGILSGNVTMQEDCLTANVYTPAKEIGNLPVVVYVHGGAYIMGHGNLFSPLRFLRKNKSIIIVTFNYRVAAHGFLCLGTEAIPGNAGMKDQVALLRWVQKNIANFGGNPNDVTIAGYSAGSSAVDLLMISKMASGLFKRVIPESGANTAAFSVQSDPLANAKRYAKWLKFDNIDDVYALEEFYQTASNELLNSVDLMGLTDSTFLFSPCIERQTSEESFLDEPPVNVLKTGKYSKLPMLYGFANMEGLLRIDQFDTWKDQMNENFSDFLPADLQFENDIQRKEVARKVKLFYFGEKPVTRENVLAYVDYFSDVLFVYPTLRSVKLQVEAGNENIYLYEYSFVDEDTPVVPYTNERGANHCAQTIAVLEPSAGLGPELKYSDKHLGMVGVMLNIWHSFITTGKPIPENSDLPKWPPVGADWSPHMSLNMPLELRGSLLKERAMFWEDVYEKHYRVPIPPPMPPRKRNEL